MGGGGLGGHKFKSQGKMSNGWSDWHQIWYTYMCRFIWEWIRQINCPERHKGTRGGGGGFRGSNIQKSGEAVKRLDRLAPTLVHMVCRFIWEWAEAKYKSPLNTPGGMSGGGGGLGGHTLKSLGKLSNGWTDWHQIWYTSVDSSGNGHRLKQLAPRYPRAALWVVLWDQQFKKVPVKLKHKIYKTVIKPTMTYGAECWTMKKKDEMLMNKTEMRMLRWIQGVSLREHKRNEEIREAATVQPIATYLMQKRLRWYGHVRRRDESHITRTVLDMEVEGVRPRGRPKLRYMDTIKRDIKKNGLTDVNILDRKDWRLAVSRAFKVRRR